MYGREGYRVRPISVFFEGALNIGLFFLTIAFIPIANVVLVFLAPLPVLFHYHKLGRLTGGLCIVVSLVAVAFVLHLSTGAHNISLFILLSCLGVVISELLRKPAPIEKTVILATTAGMALSWGMIAIQSIISDINPLDTIRIYITRSVHDHIDLYNRMEVSSEQVALIKDHAEGIIEFLTLLFPALTLVGAAIMAWINIIAARGIFMVKSIPFPDFGDLTRWKAPDKMVWFLIAAGGAVLVPASMIKWTAANVLLVCLFVYFLQGMAIVTFFFKTRRIPLFLRWTFYLLLAVQQYLIVIVIAAGLFDLWIDFRKLNRPLREEET